MNLTFEGDDRLFTASAYYVTQIKLACTRYYSGTMFSDVFACTLLHRELRDYSLGLIALVVYQALFAITQLLCC